MTREAFRALKEGDKVKDLFNGNIGKVIKRGYVNDLRTITVKFLVEFKLHFGSNVRSKYLNFIEIENKRLVKIKKEKEMTVKELIEKLSEIEETYPVFDSEFLNINNVQVDEDSVYLLH